MLKKKIYLLHIYIATFFGFSAFVAKPKNRVTWIVTKNKKMWIPHSTAKSNSPLAATVCSAGPRSCFSPKLRTWHATRHQNAFFNKKMKKRVSIKASRERHKKKWENIKFVSWSHRTPWTRHMSSKRIFHQKTESTFLQKKPISTPNAKNGNCRKNGPYRNKSVQNIVKQNMKKKNICQTLR